MHGFNIGNVCLRDLCHVSDVVLVQEHWLAPDRLHLLSGVHDDFIYFASSSMSKKLSSGVFRGRPFGGIGVFIKKSLATCTSLIAKNERFIIIKLGSIYVVNVYLPDSSVCGRDEVIADICSQIEDYVIIHGNEYIVIGGDFNLEFVNGATCCADLNSFMSDKNLRVCDSKFTDNVKYTYCHETRNCSSWIDHFAVSRSLFDKVDDAHIIDTGNNLSDHCPIWMKLTDCETLTSKASVQTKTAIPEVSRLRWDKADVTSYRDLTDRLFSTINMNNDINSDYDKILTALHTAARTCVPRGKISFFKYYWDADLDDLKVKSINAHRLWVQCGRPRSGPVFHEKRITKAEYKRAIRNKRLQRDLCVSNDLHECLLNKDMEGFWKMWKCKFGDKSPLPECVDGISDRSLIAELFAKKFEEACKPNTQEQCERLKQEFDVKYNSYCPPVSQSTGQAITVDMVNRIIVKLKNGKAAGVDGIEAEHLKLAHSKINVLLCILFNNMMSLGKVPELFCSGVIVPVPKNKHGDLTDSSNYRGITLSPVISKVFEMCLMELYSDYLYSHDLQFGFKKHLSCCNSIFIMRKVVEYFVSNGSTVNLCSLDITKAFDKVNHCALFLKLMDRHTPIAFMRILIHWYGSCTAIVKWNLCLSSCFSLICGVRQGGVLSPILFAVYINDLIVKLVKANLGCCIGSLCICCLFYADDIVLLAGSLHKLQLMLDICNTEMKFLDLKFNVAKSHVLRFGKNYANNCCSISVNNSPIAFVDSIVYLGTSIKAGRIWRTDSSLRRRQCFRAFNSIYCKSPSLSEPSLQQLVESFCKPVLLYNLAADKMSKTEYCRIEHTWNVIMYKIYEVSGEALAMVHAFTNCLPIGMDLLLRQLIFLKNCCRSDNYVVQFIAECYGCQDLSDCVDKLGISDLNVHHMSSNCIKNVVLDRFVSVTVMG